MPWTFDTQVVDASDKLAVLERYESQLECELSQQEALVAQHSLLVNQVTREIDLALEAAQRRYRDALAEVRSLWGEDPVILSSANWHAPWLLNCGCHAIAAWGSMRTMLPVRHSLRLEV
jgi:hypothetical protein